MRVLVTGGAGFIGSHTVRALVAASHEPIILDDLSTGHRELAEATGAPLIVGSIDDVSLVSRIVEEHHVSAVLHFAAKALVGESMRDPALYFTANVAASARLFQAATASGANLVVFSSSCSVYGAHDVPIDEGTPTSPINPYGASKLMVEEMLRWLEMTGTRWCALRYFNACGAASDGSLGELHEPETHLIPRLLEAAAIGTTAPVYGGDYPTPDGSAIRDYVHVEDLADAHVRALERLSYGSLGAINLGTSRGASVLDVLRTVRRVTGKEIQARVLPRRPGDPATLVASNVLAKERLGWEPHHSDLETIVSSAWRWRSIAAQRFRRLFDQRGLQYIA